MAERGCHHEHQLRKRPVFVRLEYFVPARCGPMKHRITFSSYGNKHQPIGQTTRMLRLAIVSPGAAVREYVALAPRLQEAEIVVLIGRQSVASSATMTTSLASFETLEMALADPNVDIDAVVFHDCTNDIRGQVLEAARQGMHICSSSPMAFTLSEAEEMSRVCRDIGVKLMFGNPLRFAGPNREVERVHVQGKLGTAGLLRIHHWKSTEIWLNQSSREARFAHMAGEVDVSLHTFGCVPTHVLGVEVKADQNAHTMTQVHLGFPNGGMALLDQAVCATPRAPYWSMTLIGESGAAYVDDQRNSHLLVGSGPARSIRSNQYESALLTQLREFVSAIRENRTADSSGDDGCLAQRVASVAAESCSRGEVVNFSESGQGERIDS